MTKNRDDVRMLKKFVMDRNVEGAHLPEDMGHERYMWDKEGNLYGLNLSACGLKGDLDLPEFSALEALNCGQNRLTGVWTDKCPSLKYLYCHENRIRDLDLYGNPQLVELYCSRNRLRSLNVISNPLLKSLYCGHNRLTDLDLTDCPALKRLACRKNRLMELFVGGCFMLEYLDCTDNKLAALDLSANSALEFLHCMGNRLREGPVPGKREAREAAPVMEVLFPETLLEHAEMEPEL